MKRALLACVTAIAVSVGMACPAAAATPGALTPAQASAACAAYFHVAPGRAAPSQRVSGTCAGWALERPRTRRRPAMG